MTKKIVLGVTGGRDYGDYRTVDAVLNELHEEWHFTDLVNGFATGADTLARNWAVQNDLVIHDYPANWKDISVSNALIRYSQTGHVYNARAGIDRNQKMIDKGNIDLLVKFPGNRGTDDMIIRAKLAKIMYVIVDEEGTWHYGDRYL